jgi:hypothetical protein
MRINHGYTLLYSPGHQSKSMMLFSMGLKQIFQHDRKDRRNLR